MKSKFRIEAGPKPPGNRRPPNVIYPFAAMEIGQSFTVPVALQGSLRAAAYQYGQRHGMRFVSQTEGKKVRIWRVG